jgi:hypothetical protein
MKLDRRQFIDMRHFINWGLSNLLNDTSQTIGDSRV